MFPWRIKEEEERQKREESEDKNAQYAGKFTYGGYVAKVYLATASRANVYIGLELEFSEKKRIEEYVKKNWKVSIVTVYDGWIYSGR